MIEFIVEDGTIVANSNAYVSVEEVDQYAENMRLTDWNTYSTTQKQSAIIEASQTIDLSFDFSGQTVDDDQSMDFPRDSCYDIKRKRFLDSDEIPTFLKQAVSELAILRSGKNSTLLLSENSEVLKSEAVGSLKIERFSGSSGSDQQADFLKVKKILNRILSNNRNGILIR